MDKLYEIKIYFDRNGTNDYTEKDQEKGQFILQEDGWFEGLIKDPYQENASSHFIFGAYFPDEEIELYEIDSQNFHTLRYKSQTKKGFYEGKITMETLTTSKKYAEFLISTEEIEEEKNLKNSTEILKSQIDSWKQDSNSNAYIWYLARRRSKKSFLANFRENLLDQEQSFIEAPLDIVATRRLILRNKQAKCNGKKFYKIEN